MAIEYFWVLLFTLNNIVLGASFVTAQNFHCAYGLLCCVSTGRETATGK